MSKEHQWTWDGATNFQSPADFVELTNIKTESDVRREVKKYAAAYPKGTKNEFTAKDVQQIEAVMIAYLLERAEELNIVTYI